MKETYKYCANKKINKDIPTTIQEHVEDATKNLLDNSKGKIRILVPNLDYFLEKYIEKIDMKKSNNLEIIISHSYKNKDFQKIKDLKEKYKAKIKFYEFDPTCFKEPIKELQNKKDMPRFIFIEPVGYYIGISDKKMKKSILKGIVNYGDRGRTKKLIKLFDNLKKKACKPIEC